MFQRWFKAGAHNRARPGALGAPNRQMETKNAPLVALQLCGAATWTLARLRLARARRRDANAVAYRCVRMIAEGAASVPWLLYEGARELDTHPLLDLLANAQPAMNRAPNCSPPGTGICRPRATRTSKP